MHMDMDMDMDMHIDMDTSMVRDMYTPTCTTPHYPLPPSSIFVLWIWIPTAAAIYWFWIWKEHWF